MPKLSQNKKIAVMAITIFVLSFSVMLFFLDSRSYGLDGVQANVMHSSEGEDMDVEEVYRSYLGKSEDPFFIITSEGEFRYLSENFCKILSESCSNLKGKQFSDFVNSNDYADHLAVHTKLIQKGEKVDGIGPFRMSTGEEKEKLLLFAAEPVLDSEGSVAYIVYSVNDLTKKAQELNENDDANWFKYLYPKLQELNDGEGLAEKIGFLNI